MDFSVIFQLRTKKFWWMDVIFYFVISLLVATVFCYLIFLVKDGMVRKQIVNEAAAMETVGTVQQKQHETEVLSYQKKISDFVGLLKNHEFASNSFAFMQAQTMPNIWFNQFNLDEKNNAIQLSGESDDMDAFSRQLLTLETNKYVKSIGTINSSLGESARTEFNMDLVLDQSIFNYISVASIAPTATLPNTNQTNQNNLPPIGQTTSTTTQGATTNPPASGQQLSVNTPQVANSQKLITSFHLLLTPEVVGSINETEYTITLNVPYGIDVKNLTPTIVSSPGTIVTPNTLVSQDFTKPVIYKVTAQDGSFQNYQASVIVAAPPIPVNKNSNQVGSIISAIVIFIVVVIVLLAAVILVIRRKNKKIK